METLAYDVSRCAARMDFNLDGKWCEHRQTCQRYLAWSEWDKAAGILHYRCIIVMMGREDCLYKLKTEELTR